jgi:arsenate reductase (thioredoxin)
MAKRKTVLFLCTGNSCRSQMAEALLGGKAPETFEVHSAGLEPQPIHPLTLEVLEEIGLDTSDLHPKGVERFLGLMIPDYLFIVCESASGECPTVWPGAPNMQRIVQTFEDPAAFEGDEEAKRAKFREIRDRISESLDAWLARTPVA